MIDLAASNPSRLITFDYHPLRSQLDDLRVEAQAFAESSRSKATVRAYASDLADFTAWTQAHDLRALPASAETVALYVADLARRVKPATITRRLAAISISHRLAGLETPTAHAIVRSVVKGIRRELGVAQTQKRAISIPDLRAMVSTLGESTIDVRDRALLLLGFASAMRRSEIVGLDVADVAFASEGMVITLRRSKTNQEGALETIAVPYGSDRRTCPVRSVMAWLEKAAITSGALFRFVDRHGKVRDARTQDRVVAEIVKRTAAKAGFGKIADFGGHSLRAGFATSAAKAGASERSIMRQTRHKSVEIARRYIRAGSQWDDHAATGIGL